MRTRPLFVIIGAMKCGTTSLHSYLDLHPQISMSRVKEPNFFNQERNWGRGIGWYHSLFDPEACVWGEASTNYAKFPAFDGVSDKLHAYCPDTRLIYLVRDPVDRIISHYMTMVAHGVEVRSFPAALANVRDNHYIHTSRYYAQLTQYLRLFPLEQVRIVELTTLAPERVHDTLRGLFEFLGVDPSFGHAEMGIVRHASKNKRRPTALGRALTRWVPGGRALRYALSPVIDVTVDRPSVEPDLRQRIEEALRADADLLRLLTGRAFDHWSV